jgi:predicted Zn-ribbon and HTH transcriptional regulator
MFRLESMWRWICASSLILGIGSLLLLAVSTVWAVTLVGRVLNVAWVARLVSGNLCVGWAAWSVFGETGIAVNRLPRPNFVADWPHIVLWSCPGPLGGITNVKMLLMPLWLPLMLFGTLMAMTCLRKREHLAGRRCYNCDYVFAPDATGRCPECGRPIEGHSRGRWLRLSRVFAVDVSRYPEYSLFESKYDAAMIVRRVLETRWRSGCTWIMVCLQLAVGTLLLFGASRICGNYFAMVLVMAVVGALWGGISCAVSRRVWDSRVRQELRRELVRRGWRLCIRCGYELQDLPGACPKCGLMNAR